MFKAIATLASFTLIGGLLYKYNEEIFGELKKLNTNNNKSNASQVPNAAATNAPAPVAYDNTNAPKRA